MRAALVPEVRSRSLSGSRPPGRKFAPWRNVDPWLRVNRAGWAAPMRSGRAWSRPAVRPTLTTG